MIFVENMKMLAMFLRTMYMTQFVLQVASHRIMKASNPSAAQMKRGQTLLSYKHLKWEDDVSRTSADGTGVLLRETVADFSWEQQICGRAASESWKYFRGMQ